jgi:hypothetical protein
VADQSLLFEINIVRSKYPWKKPKFWTSVITSLAWPFKTATAYHELLLEIIHRVPRIGRKHPPLHPTDLKNHVSIPDQDETKTTFHLFNCLRPPKREGKLFINKKTNTAYWGGGKQKAPLLHFHAQNRFFLKEEKIAGEGFLFRACQTT